MTTSAMCVPCYNPENKTIYVCPSMSFNKIYFITFKGWELIPLNVSLMVKVTPFNVSLRVRVTPFNVSLRVRLASFNISLRVRVTPFSISDSYRTDKNCDTFCQHQGKTYVCYLYVKLQYSHINKTCLFNCDICMNIILIV